MSRAFVREADADSPPVPLPEIPLPPPPNFVTARGVLAITTTLAGMETQLREADPATAAQLRRQQRYWLARQASAMVKQPPADPDEVGFGSRISVQWPGRGVVALELVGDDEAAPEAGRVAWRAPTAAALTGYVVGDVVEVTAGGGMISLTILAVDNRTGDIDRVI